MTALLGSTSNGDVAIDLDRLVGGHAAIIANSGGGKSGLLRRLLEQTHGSIQHIILDVEDEFYTLRERYDYVIAGGDDGERSPRLGAAGYSCQRGRALRRRRPEAERWCRADERTGRRDPGALSRIAQRPELVGTRLRC